MAAGRIRASADDELSVRTSTGLAGLAADNGARLVIVNAEPTPYDNDQAAEVVREPIGTALPRLLAELTP